MTNTQPDLFGVTVIVPHESTREERYIDFSMVRSTTTGWTDCGHDNYRPGVVLDPFAGSGTTLSVATGHGRDAIGIALDERNAELAVGRIGGFFVAVEDHRTAGVA